MGQTRGPKKPNPPAAPQLEDPAYAPGKVQITNSGEVVGEEALRLAESEGGKALMKAEHRVWPDSFIRYWNPKSPVALSLFVVIFKGLF